MQLYCCECSCTCSCTFCAVYFFSQEEEQDNKLAFLDVLLIRTTDGSIVTSIYRKPTFSGLYMKWDSFVPKSYKKGLVNCLVFRAWKLCSSYVLFHSEILFVKELLMSNGYPANFIDSIVHRFLSKQFSNTDVMQPYGPHKRRVYLCLPYVGELAKKTILPHKVKIEVECFKSEWCCVPNFLFPM